MILYEVKDILQNAVLVVCFVTVLILFDLYRKRHIFKFARNFKGYAFYPIIGNAHRTFGRDLFSVVEDFKKVHGLPCNIWNGHSYHYVTIDASEIKIVLNHTNTFNKGSIYDNFSTAFGDTLLLAKFDQWKRNRKILSKSFSQTILNRFVNTMYGKSCQLVEILRDDVSQNKSEILCRFALDNFCANNIGMNLDIQKNMQCRLPQLADRIQYFVGQRLFTSYFIPEFIYFLTLEGKECLADFFEIRDFVFKIIQQKREALKMKKDSGENMDKLNLIDMMLEATGTTFTDNDIFKETVLFTLAATDTSGMTLFYTFLLLALNPEAQERLYEEVNEVVGLDAPICYSDLPNLKYTERTLLESMRLLPVTPVIERYVEADTDLGSRIVPAGTNVLISVFNLHRSEKYWKDPLIFDPDRFLPDENAQRHPYAFLTFSAGPRNCIGMKYGMMMMKTAVANVIRNYQVKCNNTSLADIKFMSCVTMRPISRIDLSFVSRVR